MRSDVEKEGNRVIETVRAQFYSYLEQRLMLIGVLQRDEDEDEDRGGADKSRRPQRPQPQRHPCVARRTRLLPCGGFVVGVPVIVCTVVVCVPMTVGVPMVVSMSMVSRVFAVCVPMTVLFVRLAGVLEAWWFVVGVTMIM